MRLISLLKNNWFICSIPFVVFFAWIYPTFGCKGGAIKPEITVKYFAVSVIFLISGLSLQTKDLTRTIANCYLHLFIQIFTLVFVPIFVLLFTLILSEFGVNDDLLMGFTAVSCMPPPVSSAIILTKSVGGNEAAAIFNSVLGSFLGILVTPSLLFLLLGSSTMLPIRVAILQLFLTVILPLIIGQYIHHKRSYYFITRKTFFSKTGCIMLLIIIYSTFCDTFVQSNSLDFLSTISIGILVIFLQVVLLYLVFIITNSSMFHLRAADSVAAMFCATHKSLTLGIPMLKILYGEDKRFPLISFPLLLYHPIQILLGSMLIPFLQHWMWNFEARFNKGLYPV